MILLVKIRRIIRNVAISIRYAYLKKIMKMNIARSAKVSFGAKLDKTYPKGIIIGDESYIASGSMIFSHDYARDIKKATTKIGKRCFIGANSIILCGISIGDEVIVAAGAIVTKDVPSNCIVAGNPAKVIKSHIRTKKYGQLLT